MSTERVWLHPDAIAEAQAAYEWYRLRNPEIAEAFMAELDRGIELILEGRSQWAPLIAGTRRFLMRRFPYLIIFRDSGDAVQVIAIAHARRQPGYWKSR